jgi:hypothetical protein
MKTALFIPLPNIVRQGKRLRTYCPGHWAGGCGGGTAPSPLVEPLRTGVGTGPWVLQKYPSPYNNRPPCASPLGGGAPASGWALGTQHPTPGVEHRG